MRGGRDFREQVDIVVVNRNTASLLLTCLKRLVPVLPLRCRVLVVDNASSDGSTAEVRKRFPGVRCIANATEVGYASAANRGIAEAGAPFVLLLNPDATVDPGILGRLLDLMLAHPEAGAAGGMLEWPCGAAQETVSYFPTLPRQIARVSGLSTLMPRLFRRRFSAAGQIECGAEAGPVRVDWMVGAALLLRREALEGVGLLDEGFRFYGEDLDICYRLRHRGWLTYVLPTARVVHLGTPGERDRAGRLRQVLTEAAMLRFFDKHRGPVEGWVLRVAIFISSLVAAAAWGSVWCSAAARRSRARERLAVHAARMLGPSRYLARVTDGR